MRDDNPRLTATANDVITPGNYAFLAFLTLLNVLNFVDRQLLPSFANFIKPDLKLTDTEYGLLKGLFFIVFYAAMGLFMGALADLVHRPRLIAAGLTLRSALVAFTALSTLAIPLFFFAGLRMKRDRERLARSLGGDAA